MTIEPTKADEFGIARLTAERLREILHYDPESGVFRWLWRESARPEWNGRYAGKVAGCARRPPGGNMYWQISINKRFFAAHRLAVLYMTGSWPKVLVDHRDLDGTNNRWTNLREANQSQNAANTKLRKTNVSGLKGVSFDKIAGRFLAQIRLGGRKTNLGLYDTAEAAHAAYMHAAIAQHGKFARSA